MSTRTSSRRLREQVRPLLVALCAGGLYGSWAGFVQRGLGPGVAICAGCTQVGLSMFTTLVFVLLLERVFRWPSNPVHGFWAAALVSSTLGTAWLAVGHALAGTPHITAAIAPSVIVGGVFDFAYAGRLLMLASGPPMSPGHPERQGHRDVEPSRWRSALKIAIGSLHRTRRTRRMLTVKINGQRCQTNPVVCVKPGMAGAQ